MTKEAQRLSLLVTFSLRLVIFAAVLGTVSACASPSGSGQATTSAKPSETSGAPKTAASPDGVARQAFESNVNTPYSDVRTTIVKNDGAFATVDLNAKIRRGPDTPWVDSIVRYELSKVGESWRVTSAGQLRAIADITSAASAAIAASKDEQAQNLAKDALKKIIVVVGKPIHGPGEGIKMQLTIKNPDPQEHKIGFIAGLSALSDSSTARGWWQISGTSEVVVPGGGSKEIVVLMDTTLSQSGRDQALQAFRSAPPNKTERPYYQIRQIDSFGVSDEVHYQN